MDSLCWHRQVSEDLNLNVRVAIGVVEKTMEELNKKKMDLSDLWTSWQLHVSQVKSIKKQWKKYKEQLKQVHKNKYAMYTEQKYKLKI